MIRRPPRSTLLSLHDALPISSTKMLDDAFAPLVPRLRELSSSLHTDRKSTRLNSSHTVISYAVFCLKKKKKTQRKPQSHIENLDNDTKHRASSPKHGRSSDVS